MKPRRAVPGVKAGGACRAVACWLPWVALLRPVPYVCSARGEPSPTALLGQACLLDRTRPLSLASHGPLLHGCARALAPGVRATLAARLGVTSPALTCLAAWGTAVADVRGCGGGECWGARALLTGLDPHPAPTPPTIQYPSPVPGYLFLCFEGFPFPEFGMSSFLINLFSFVIFVCNFIGLYISVYALYASL